MQRKKGDRIATESFFGLVLGLGYTLNIKFKFVLATRHMFRVTNEAAYLCEPE